MGVWPLGKGDSVAQRSLHHASAITASSASSNVSSAVDNNFNLQRHLISRSKLRILREAFRTRQAVTAAWPGSNFPKTWAPFIRLVVTAPCLAW